MRSHAQLCHVSSDRCVVLVEAYEGTTPLGSALGEGRSAIEAEDQALERLRARLGTSEPAKAEELTTTTSLTSVEGSIQPGGSKQLQPIRRVAPPEI